MAEQQIRVTVLFVDVSDSVRLYESLGDAVAFREVRECLTVFQEVVAAQLGRVVKTIGDGSMCVFNDPDSAVLAACEMQARVQERQTVQNHEIGIRIGLNHGAVLIADDDVYGDTVNIASRMAQVAASGQIITTGETVTLLSPALRGATRRLDELAVKGKHDEVTVYEVLWQTGSDHTQVPGRMDSVLHQAGAARLRLRHAGREIIVITSINMGRHANNGIVLKDPMASRHHSFIERRKDKFLVVDQSSNGTFIAMKGGEEFKLRREEMILYGSGVITFGHRARDKNAEIIAFWCESRDDVAPALASPAGTTQI